MTPAPHYLDVCGDGSTTPSSARPSTRRLYRGLGPLIRSRWVAVTQAGKGRTKLVRLTTKGQRVTDAAAEPWEAAQSKVVEAFGVVPHSTHGSWPLLSCRIRDSAMLTTPRDKSYELPCSFLNTCESLIA